MWRMPAIAEPTHRKRHVLHAIVSEIAVFHWRTVNCAQVFWYTGVVSTQADGGMWHAFPQTKIHESSDTYTESTRGEFYA